MAKKQAARTQARKQIINIENNVGPGYKYAGITYNHEVYLVARDELSSVSLGEKTIPACAYRMDALNTKIHTGKVTKITDPKILEGIASEWIDNIQGSRPYMEPVIKRRGNFLAPLGKNGSRIHKDQTRPRDKY